MNQIRLILDGQNLCYVGGVVKEIEDLKTSDGVRSNISFGFIKQIRNILELFQPADVIVVWDHGHSEKRLAILPSYKDRGEQDEVSMMEAIEFRRQRDVCQKLVDCFGIKQLKIKGWEGDDLVYVIAEASELPVIIVSTDQDFCQLVSDKVSVYNPIKKMLIDLEDFEKITETRREQFLDLKILTGDNSDNIPSVQKRFGWKTAQKMLDKFGSLDAIVDHDRPWEGISRCPVFEDGWRERILRNAQLMVLGVLITDEEKAMIRDQYQAIAKQKVQIDEAKIFEMFAKLEFASLRARWLDFKGPFVDLTQSCNS